MSEKFGAGRAAGAGRGAGAALWRGADGAPPP